MKNYFFISLCFVAQLHAMELEFFKDMHKNSDLIYNGFKQFLGNIHHYKFEQKLPGGVVNSPPCVYEVNDNKYVVRTY